MAIIRNAREWKPFHRTLLGSPAAEIEVTNVPAFDVIRFYGYFMNPDADNNRLVARVSDDNGASYKAGASDYQYVNHYALSSGTDGAVASLANSYLYINRANELQDSSLPPGADFWLEIAWFGHATRKPLFKGNFSGFVPNNPYLYTSDLVALYNTASALNAIKFMWDASANFIAGGVLIGEGKNL